MSLKKKYSEVLYKVDNGNSSYQRLLDLLFEYPIVSKKQVSELLNVSEPTGATVCNEFVKLGILVDDTPEKKRYKKYRFAEYVEILQKGTEL